MKSQLHAFLLINQQVVFEWAVDADAGNRPCFEIFGPRMKYLAAAAHLRARKRVEPVPK
jgi:hypothetical protein